MDRVADHLARLRHGNALIEHAEARQLDVHADFFAVYRKVMSEYTEADQRKIFHDNAVKFYRL